MLCNISMNAQEWTNYSNAKIKFLATDAEQNKDYMTAAELYEELCSRKPNNQAFKYSLARNLHQSSQYSKAIGVYQGVVNESKEDFPLAAFYLGRLMIMEGKCEESVEILQQFRKDYRGEKDDRRYRKMAQYSIQSCTESQFTDEGNLIVQPLPSEINGSNMEGAPLFESENRVLYNSLKADPNKTFEEGESLPQPQFFLAVKTSEGWKLDGEWNELKVEEGYSAVSGTFNPDRTRFYFSACKELYSSQMQCDLFKIELKNGKWSEAEKIDIVNTNAQERHPAVGYDEKGRETLYFVSDREEGKGGFDLWYSTYYEKKDLYREAKNCGSKINSVGDELSPFIDPESGVLYFSSDAHPGLGGLDVFRSTGGRSKWMEPENLGTKINGPTDELYYVLDPSAQSGMFVSNRTYGKKKQPCCDDLFYFTDPDLISLNYKGELNDQEGNPLDQASVFIYEVEDSTGEEYLRKRVTTNEDGSFDFRLEPNKKYKVRAEKKGFFANSKAINTSAMLSSRDVRLSLDLEKITNKAFILENIYYEFDKDVLTKDAVNTIDTTIYEILIENPSIVVEIGSHTDSKGTLKYNNSLSQRRAESVVKYLIKKGISKERISARGYGETQPIAPNKNPDGSDNPKGRAKNRRTEFKVVGEINLIDQDD